MKTQLITVVLALTTGGVFAFCSDPAPPRLEWSGSDFSGANLARANLTHAFLRRAAALA
jgi:hypothetical protein